jgi:hypothetical protein
LTDQAAPPGTVTSKTAALRAPSITTRMPLAIGAIGLTPGSTALPLSVSASGLARSRSAGSRISMPLAQAEGVTHAQL